MRVYFELLCVNWAHHACVYSALCAYIHILGPFYMHALDPLCMYVYLGPFENVGILDPLCMHMYIGPVVHVCVRWTLYAGIYILDPLCLYLYIGPFKPVHEYWIPCA